MTTLWGLRPTEARWDSGWQYAAAPFSNYVPIQVSEMGNIMEEWKEGRIDGGKGRRVRGEQREDG